MSDTVFWTTGGLAKTEEMPVSGNGDFFSLVVMLGILREKDMMLHWASVFVSTIVDTELEEEYQKIFEEAKETEKFMLCLFLLVEVKLLNPGYTFKLNIREMKRIIAFNKLVSK